MDELDQLKIMAADLLGRTKQENNADSVVILEKATAALKVIRETEKAIAETRKLAAEEKKLAYDLEQAPNRDKSEQRKAFISLLTPIITTAVLAATLIAQTYQFTQSEKNKRDAAEDAQWSDGIKALSQSEKLSQPAVILSPFLKSKRYRDLARQAAQQLLMQTEDYLVFKDLFKSAFEPIDWNNLPTILEINRSVWSKLNAMLVLTWDSKAATNDLTKLTKEDRERYEHFWKVIQFLGTSVAPLLQAPRPQGQSLDLRFASFEGDWKGANLSRANLAYSGLYRVNLQGANLSEITQFEGSSFYQTAWWEAARISTPLLDYLVQHWAYNPDQQYGSLRRRVEREEFQTALSRLKGLN